MEKFCPLPSHVPVYEHDIPDVCRETCGQLWDDAVASDAIAGPYDTYAHEGDSEFSCVADSEYSDAALHAIGKQLRNYVIVDECTKHGVEVGEQGFQFNCPLPLES